MIRCLFTIVFVFLFNFLNAQLTDTNLIVFNDLHFNSEFETKLFDSINNKAEVDKINMFCFTSAGLSQEKLNLIHSKLNLVYKEASAIEIKKGKEEKAITKISEIIHSYLFVKYRLENEFCSVFEKGEYNCVSSTAVFALVFEKLKIPYKIIELPTHVYLVAYPEGKSIKVETTDAEFEYLIIKPEMKKEYVNYLLKTKVISQEEYKAEGVEEIFSKNYFGENGLNLKQLAGVQYYNKGLFLIDNADYQEAYYELAKAYYLFPSPRIKYILYSALVQTFTDGNYYKTEYPVNLSLLTRFDSTMIGLSTLEEEFNIACKKFLVDKTDSVKFHSLYSYLESNVRNPQYLKAFSFIYHYNMMLFCKQLEYDEAAFYHAEISYDLNPNHLYVKPIFLEMLMGHFDFFDSETPANKVLEEILKYEKKYPNLVAEKQIVELKLIVFLENAMQLIKNKKYAEAQIVLDDFEKKFGKDQIEKMYISQQIEDVYGKMVLYYFGKGNKAKAREMVKRGLILFPESYDLKRKSEVLH